MPLTDRKQARESGFAQVREALVSFEGDVIGAEFGRWGGQLFDDNGKPLPPKEFLEITCTNVEPVETTEELAMAIVDWNFRVNCSEFTGSFWVDKFLESTDKFKLLVPDDLVGKRILWRKETLEARDPKFNSTNYVVAKVLGDIGEKAKESPTTEDAPTPEPTEGDPMDTLKDLAIGKTDAQFKSAVSLKAEFKDTPFQTLVKSGAIQEALLKEGKLTLVKEGSKEVYREPE